MGVLIKGMEMPPRGCCYCFLRNGNWCSRLPDVPAVEIINSAKEEKRHELCPLVEIPSNQTLNDNHLVK